jgi:cytochrome c2
MSRATWCVQRACVVGIAAVIAMPVRAQIVPQPGNAANGERLFNRRCSGCHALVEHRAGPRLGDVYGRRAGTAVGYRYSDAIVAQRFAWADSTLDRWLAGPRDFIRGVAMPVRIDKVAERADIIAYLRAVTLTGDRDQVRTDMRGDGVR